MPLSKELSSLFLEFNLRPSRKLSQNFVVNEALIEFAVKLAELKPSDTVLEVGAGTGFLSRELLKHCKVIAVEKDPVLVELLKEKLPEKNLKLIEADVLETKLPAFNKIVSFPPYHISSSLMFNLLQKDFELAILCFHSEFIEKLIAKPGFLDYNALSVLTNYFCSTEVIESSISPASFYPRPNAFSVLIKLTKEKKFGQAKDEQKFAFFLKTLFRFRNKNLSKALKLSEQFLKQKGISLPKKLEEKLSSKKINVIEVKEFVELFNSMI